MKRIFILLSIVALLLLTAGGIFFYKIKSDLFIKEYGFIIEGNESPRQLFKSLESDKAITSKDIPLYLSKIKGLKELKPGYYQFRKGNSANYLINILRAGKESPINITFNNTRTLPEFVGKISDQIMSDSLELIHALQNDSIIKSYGFNKENFIGMFIPNTYEVYYTITPLEFISRMNKEYNRFWSPARKKKAERLGYTPQQISTLASIVDEETNKSDEKARIAGVYLNRLKRNIPLQADPTLKFAAGDFTLRRILNKHMEIDSPYNTYMYAGLPPGPIRQPSISGLKAVLNAEDHNYLYFCAKADFSGYHAFAKTLSQHNRNAAAYHRALNQRGIRK